MNADRQLTIDRIVALHLRVECPPSERPDSSRRQLAMFTRFQHHHGDLGMLGDQQASLHPIIDFLSIQRGGNARPWRKLGHRAQLLILIEGEAMHMHFRQFKDIFLMIALMRGLITDHRVEYSRPHQGNSKDYSINTSHRLAFYAITARMLKRATLLARLPQCKNAHDSERPHPRSRPQRCSTRCPTGSSSKAAGSPTTEAYPCGTLQGDGRPKTMLVTVFGIWLEEPLPAEEERPRHTGMRHSKTDTAFTLVDEILLIQCIHNIKPDDKLLAVPR
jgi:hypothetical protein